MTVPTKSPADAFHSHLDDCEPCRISCFNLCSTGQALLIATAPPSVVKHVYAFSPTMKRFCQICGRHEHDQIHEVGP